MQLLTTAGQAKMTDGTRGPGAVGGQEVLDGIRGNARVGHMPGGMLTIEDPPAVFSQKGHRGMGGGLQVEDIEVHSKYIISDLIMRATICNHSSTAVGPIKPRPDPIPRKLQRHRYRWIAHGSLVRVRK